MNLCVRDRVGKGHVWQIVQNALFACLPINGNS